jgi:hypothetical protein
MSPVRILLCLAFVAVPGTLAAQDTTHAAPKIKRNPDLITTQEIEATSGGMQTAYDLVKQLRGGWLAVHGRTSVVSAAQTVQVYVDGLRRGDPSALTEVPRGSIREIQHLRGADATQRFGSNHENGAILVITK